MVRLITALFGLTLGFTAFAAEPFEEGTHYDPVIPAQPTSAGPGEVEVLELFWYGCPHCFAFETNLEGYLQEKPDAVKFVRVPAILNPTWALYARAYYTAETLNVFEKFHRPFFNAIHVDRQPINNEDAIASFFTQATGVTDDVFRRTFNSFAVTAKVQRADVLTKRYRITGVPTIAVAGKYKNNSRGGMRNYEDFINLAKYLAYRELQGEE